MNRRAKSAPVRQIATVTIGKYCSATGCRKVGQIAYRVSDFWIVRCEEHKYKSMTVDFKKIPAENADPRLLQ